MKTIFRSNPQKEFTVLANRMLRDRTLSFKARGMLAMIMTHSESWEVHASWISDQGTEGREAISSGLTELEASGYVQYQQVNDETTGQFSGGMWTFSDSPCAENQRTNKTRWREKYAEAEAAGGQVKAAGNRGKPPETTGSRMTAETTGSRDTGTPYDGNPSSKKKEGSTQKNNHSEDQDEVLLAIDAIKEIFLPLFGRQPKGHLSCEEMHTIIDVKTTMDRALCVVRFYKLPEDSKKPGASTRKKKFLALIQNWYEQEGLALQACPPAKVKPAGAGIPATTVPTAPERTPEEQAASHARHERRMALFRQQMKGGPDGAAAAKELAALDHPQEQPAMAIDG